MTTTSRQETDASSTEGPATTRRRVPRTFLEPDVGQKTAQLLVAEVDTASPEQQDAAGDERTDREHVDGESLPDEGLLLEAGDYEISLGADEDPFGSTLLLAADNTSGEEIAVWLRLTPTVIAGITRELINIFRTQQEALGLIAGNPFDDGVEDTPDEEDNDDANREGLLRRASDPMGIRHLRDRPRTLKWLAIGIGSLVLISVILQLTVYR